MDLYEVLEKRRTYRDFSDREVSDEIVKKIISAAFKAPTNDHLRQLEFIVVRTGKHATCRYRRRTGNGIPHPRERRS